MLPNPYTPGGRPRVFVGREQERQRLRGHLARVIAYGEMMGPLTITTGPRGVGKTSLMRDVQEDAEKEGLVVAWVAGVKHTPFLSDVVDEIQQQLRVHDLQAKSGRGVRVREVGAELNLGLAKFSTKLDPAIREPEAPPALVGQLSRFLHEASTAIRDRGGAGLVIIIDELHEPLESTRSAEYAPNPAARADAAVLLNAAQNMDANRTEYPLAILGAGLPETKPLLMRAATFGERTRELAMGELDPASSKALLALPAQALGVAWDEAALERATEEANGYPYALQVTGEATWDAALPEAGDTITLQHVNAGREQAFADMVSMYRGRLALATPAERNYLGAMAQLATPVARRAEMAELLGEHPDALNPARDSLISKGIIESAGRGLVRFTIPGFGDYIRRLEDKTVAGDHDLTATTEHQPVVGLEQEKRTPPSPGPGTPGGPNVDH